MSKQRMIKITIICTFLITVIPVSSISSSVNPIPIIPIELAEDEYIPEVYGEDWNYYILPPGTIYDDIEYWGTSTDKVYYTSVGTNVFNSYQIGSTLTRGNLIPGSLEGYLLENTSYASDHAFFDPIPYPRAVRIANEVDPTFNQTLIKPLSLHMDYASTFFAVGVVDYWGFVESSEPFYFDVAFSATNVEGLLSFESAFPDNYVVGIPENRMTYPIFPINEGVQIFHLITNASTLVTLIPHPWDYPSRIPDLTSDAIVTGELSQGEPWYKDQETDQLIDPENEQFSIRMFNLSLVKDKYYRIGATFDMEQVKPGVLSNEPVRFLVGDHYERISGQLDQDGMIVRARESEGATLVLYSPGEANGQYSIFYQEIPSTVTTETSPLTLNTNITLEYDIYYTFTFDTPHMMAINWTSATDSFDLIFYIQGDYPDVWIPISDEDFFNPEEGNLFGDSVGDIAVNHDSDANWRYIPAGTYAIELDRKDQFDREIRFTTVPIRSPGTLTVNKDSLFAVELPMVRNRLNWVNISTADHIYPLQSVRYEWTFVGKYNSQVSPATNSEWFGNVNTTTGWAASNYNDSIVNAILPTRDYEVPILMIHPYSVWNYTSGTEEHYPFSATLKVSTNTATDQSAYNLAGLGVSPFISSIASGYLYSGSTYFIPLSAISTSTGFNINNAYSTDNDHLYGIPLTLDPYSIYNITVYLHGNYTYYDPGDSGHNEPDEFLNATFEDSQLFVHGGNLRDLEIFGTYIEDWDNTSIWRSLLALTVSNTSYLYVDLKRDGGPAPDYYNLTMQVVINKLSASNIEFELDFEYNSNVSELEVKNRDLMANEIIPPEMAGPGGFPFEVLLLLGGIAVAGAVIAAAVMYIRKKRSYL